MRSNVSRLMFWFLLLAGILTASAIAKGEITLDVAPKVALPDPYKSQTFRVRVRVAEHPDNRVLSLSADCGSNAYSSQHDVDQVTYTRYYEMRVRGDCTFQACVFRNTNGKVVRFCAPVVVKTPEQPP